jgi:HD-GYP domain-containing protein (c-di-GMP phosphodiesterase class II)
MITPDPRVTGAARQSIVDTMQSTEGTLRQFGRNFLVHFYAALRSLKLYPVENAQVQRSLDDVSASARTLLGIEDELEVRVAGEFIFVNGTRLRLDMDNYASFSHVLTTLRQSGVGIMRVDGAVERREWQVLISLLLTFAGRELTPNKLYELQQKLTLGGVTHVTLDPPAESDEEMEDEEKAKEIAKRTYERTVAVTKEVVSSVRMGRSASVKKVKRAVQGIVDQVLKNEVSLIGLTTIRDYDEYTFVHSVNVTIFAVSIGKRLGLTKLQLYDLGLAALFHDVGKSRVPVQVLNKSDSLSEDEWRIMQAHPWLGVLVLFGLRGYGEIPYRPMIAAYEHHMKIDLTGYPKSLRPRQLSVYSKIIAVADAFDAATSRRVYASTPLEPADILKEMWENPRRGQDPTLVKAFINLTGIYPVGTCVILDTYEVAIVHAANPVPEMLHRPLIRIALTDEGGHVAHGPVIDLADTDPDGSFKRTIVKVTNPDRYGIKPSDYFV